MSEDENDDDDEEWSGTKDSEDDEEQEDVGQVIKKEDKENEKIESTHASVEKLLSAKISVKQLVEPTPKKIISHN